jgi:hypothetical protein
MRRGVLLLLVAVLSLFAAAGAQAWTWPAGGPVLRSFAFDPASPYAAGQHRDIVVGGLPGESVLAPAAGAIGFAGSVPGSGLAVTVRTPDGYAVTLVHLGSIAVARGDDVVEGQPIGAVGDAAAVYLGIRVASSQQGYLDPLGLLPARGVSPGDPAPSEPAAAHGPDQQGGDAPGDAPAVTGDDGASDPANALDPAQTSTQPDGAVDPADGTDAPAAGSAPVAAQAPMADGQRGGAAIDSAPSTPASASDATDGASTPTGPSSAATSPAPADPAPAVPAPVVAEPGPTEPAPPAPPPAPALARRVAAPAPAREAVASEAAGDAVSTPGVGAHAVAAGSGRTTPAGRLRARAPIARSGVGTRPPVTRRSASPGRPALATRHSAGRHPIGARAGSRRTLIASAGLHAPVSIARRSSRARAVAAALGHRRPIVAPRRSRRLPWVLFVLAAVVAAAAAAAIGARIMRRSERHPSEAGEDPGRGGVALCERAAPYRPCRGLRRPLGHLRPLPPAPRQRRADGERNRRARHAGDGRRRSRGHLAA